MMAAPSLSHFMEMPYSSREIIEKLELLDEEDVVGSGGFGTVYKMVMDDCSAFAVKRIDRNREGSDQIFERELEILGSIKHINLINLRGYCKLPSAKLLIYDYVALGSLDDYLHEHGQELQPLNWNARMKIAIGSARGLAYLHHDCSPVMMMHMLPWLLVLLAISHQANVHLDSNRDHTDVKLWQVHILLKGLEKIAVNVKIPVLMCVDINSHPKSVLYDLLTKGKVDELHPDLPEYMVVDPSHFLNPASKMNHELPLVSAYSTFRMLGPSQSLEQHSTGRE